jgi:hypothetical protein
MLFSSVVICFDNFIRSFQSFNFQLRDRCQEKKNEEEEDESLIFSSEVTGWLAPKFHCHASGWKKENRKTFLGQEIPSMPSI